MVLMTTRTGRSKSKCMNTTVIMNVQLKKNAQKQGDRNAADEAANALVFEEPGNLENHAMASFLSAVIGDARCNMPRLQDFSSVQEWHLHILQYVLEIDNQGAPSIPHIVEDDEDEQEKPGSPTSTEEDDVQRTEPDK